MTGDKKKENRWAKVLDDAGLLDDVEDAWELPEGNNIADGATIEVKSVDTDGRPSVPIVESSKPADERLTRDDETQKVITVISADDNEGTGEDTVRVSYADKQAREEILGKQANTGNRMPLQPVRPSRDSLEKPPGDEHVPRTDTDPGQLAHHTRNSLIDEPQPEYAVDDEMDWDSLMDDDRPTREVPRYSQHQNSVAPPPPGGHRHHAHEEPELEFDLTDETLDDNEVEPGDRRDEREEGQRETFDRGVGSRITVQGLHDNLTEPEGDGMIMDVPMASFAPEPIELAPPSLQIQMTEKYDMNDFSGALDIAEQILEMSPNDIDAFQYKKSCRERLLKMYEARIGEMQRVPSLKVNDRELMWRNLDAAAGFILSRIDGVSTFGDILDISGMPRFETCRILFQLIEDGLIG